MHQDMTLKLSHDVEPKLWAQIMEYAKLLEFENVFGPGMLEPTRLT